MTGRERAEPRQTQRQKIAALRIVERMQFIQHHGPQIFEHLGAAGMRQKQRQLLRRGEQNVGRAVALALTPGGGGVAGSGLNRNRQAPSRGWAHPDCAPRPPRAPSGERYRAYAGRACGRVWAPAVGRPKLEISARSMSVGRKPARVLPPPVGATSSTLSPFFAHAPPAPADGRAACQPRDANQSWNFFGSRAADAIAIGRLAVAIWRAAWAANKPCGRRKKRVLICRPKAASARLPACHRSFRRSARCPRD